MANVKKPFIRSRSLGSMFKRRRDQPYQSWKDEDSLIDGPGPHEGEHTHQQPVIHFRKDSPTPPTPAEAPKRVALRGSTSLGPLLDCFYLGHRDMTGMSVQGRGCIDGPSAQIWEQTQEPQRRRKNSLPPSLESSTTSFKPKYVRLVATASYLQIYDCYSNELLIEFNYEKISFVGTHPKYQRLFAFIAVAQGKKTPFIHVFKCEDELSASNTACTLSNIFQRKIRELLEARDQRQKQIIQINSSATVVK